MILQALTEYYQSLVQAEKIAAPGWKSSDISFVLCISDEGELEQVISIKNQVSQGKKTVLRPQSMILPVPADGRTSTAVRPNFLWDKSDYVETVKEDATGYRIYVKDGVPLNRSDAEAYAALDVDEKTVKEKKKADPDLDRKVRDWMCANFYDVRTFGAVMTTFVKAALNCGQVRGPVQLGFARSVEPVIPQEITITRVAITTEADAEKKGTEMGRKYVIPYGLYRCEGYVSANLARKTTGFSEEDLSLLWEAILNMFEHDHSAARGKMAVRELIVFQHDNELGCAPAWKLFEAVHVTRRDPGDPAPARSYQDYSVTVDEAALPAGITCRRMG